MILKKEEVTDWLLETLQKPARWDQPTAPSNTGSASTLPLADQGETLSKENGGTRESRGCWLVGW